MARSCVLLCITLASGIDESRGWRVNKWNIPGWLEQEVIARDQNCVYCGIEFSVTIGKRGSRASWEHIVNDERIVNRQNIARCCISCNASKGAKELSVWLKSAYCERRGITEGTVADVVKRALIDPPLGVPD
jgi:hypothetical protein